MFESKLTDDEFEFKISGNQSGEYELAINVSNKLIAELENYFESLITNLIQLEKTNNAFQEIPEPIKNAIHTVLISSKIIAADIDSIAVTIVSITKKLLLQEMGLIKRNKSVYRDLKGVTSLKDEEVYKECLRKFPSIQEGYQKLLALRDLYNQNQYPIVNLYSKELSLLKKNVSLLEEKSTQLSVEINKIDPIKFKIPHELYKEILANLQTKINSCKKFCEDIVSWRIADKKLLDQYGFYNSWTINQFESSLISMYEKLGENKVIHLTNHRGNKADIAPEKIALYIIKHFKGKISGGKIQIENIEKEKNQIIAEFIRRNDYENQEKSNLSSNSEEVQEQKQIKLRRHDESEYKIINDDTGEFEFEISVNDKSIEKLTSFFPMRNTLIGNMTTKYSSFRELPQQLVCNLNVVLVSSEKIAVDFLKTSDLIISLANEIIAQQVNFLLRWESVKNKLNTIKSANSRGERIFQECLREILLTKDEYIKILMYIDSCKTFRNGGIELFEKNLSTLKSDILLLDEKSQLYVREINELNKTKFAEPHKQLSIIYTEFLAQIDSCKKFCELVVSWSAAVNVLKTLYYKYHNLMMETLENAFINMYENNTENNAVQIKNYGGRKVDISPSIIAPFIIKHFKGKIFTGEIKIENIEDEKIQVIVNYMEANLNINPPPYTPPSYVPIYPSEIPHASAPEGQNNSIHQITYSTNTAQYQANFSSSRYSFIGSNSATMEGQNQPQQNNIDPPKSNSFFFCCGHK